MICNRIGLNLSFIDGGPLTGPGVYARELVEQLVRQAEDDAAIELVGYTQPTAYHHFSVETQRIFVPVGPFSGRGSRVLWEQLRLPLLARRQRIDLLFSPAFVSPLWGAKHLVATIHDMYYQVVPNLIPVSQRWYWRLMIPLTARVCDVLIAVSENTRHDIGRHIRAARKRVMTIHLASRYGRVKACLPAPSEADGPYVLLVANVTANKNPAALIAAMSELRHRLVPLRLMHVGKDNQGLLAEAVRAEGMEATVLQLGKVSDEHLQALYQHALCTVHPSLYEGFGLPVLEAQALGSPLVCSNRGSLPEIAGTGATLVDPTDPSALADAIAELFAKPDRRTELIARGYANLERFSWEKTAAQTLQLFRTLLA